MATTRDDLQRSLAVQDPEVLRLILDASEVDARSAVTSSELAGRIVDAIWWNYSTPLGYVAERASFEDIVGHLARRLKVADRVDPDLPVWDRVAALTSALVDEIPPGGISLTSLDPSTRERLGFSWVPPLGLGVGAGSSFATRWGAGHLLTLLKSPIGRLLPLLPAVGPWVGAIRTGVAAVHLVAGPLGIALSVMSLNSALGANYHRLVPLVLGVGALRPARVEDAQEVGDPVAAETPPVSDPLAGRPSGTA